MKKIFPFLFLFVCSKLCAQNVGIGNTNPSEKLDVNGNVNISGTIKANGVDGQPNQVLMKNNTGSLAWGDLSQFKKAITFLSNGSWTVPAGVTQIAVEAWGGGGGSTNYSGGGGGGYIYAVFAVTPAANINFSIGTGGIGNSSISGNIQAGDGGTTSLGSQNASLSAYGGDGSIYSQGSSYGFVSAGGSYAASPLETFYYYGIKGQAGTANSDRYEQSAPGIFFDIENSGKGGDGGNSSNTGGAGGFQVYNVTSSVYVNTINSIAGGIPRGGGGAGFKRGGSAYNGANGMVIIHY
jgi:hypothetical protein